MELDTKESELETIQLKLAHINLDTASLSSGTGDFNELVHHEETSLEGKQNTLSFCLLFVHILVFFRLVTNPFKAKYSSSRLEKVVRDCFFQENHFLPFRNRATKCRSNTNSWSKVSLLTKYLQLIFINCFAYVCLQQSIPCAVSYPRWCHSRRSQRYPKNIPGKHFIFVYFFRICLHLITLFTDLCKLLTFYRFDYICLNFQILYAGEGESRKPEDNIGDDSISSVVSSSGNVVMNKSVIGSGKAKIRLYKLQFLH